MNFFHKLCSLLLVLALLIGISVQPSMASSKTTKQIDRVAEVTIESRSGEVKHQTILLTKGTELDESTFEDLKDGWQLKNFKIEEINDDSQLVNLASENGSVTPFFVDTIFDVGNFTISLAEFVASPSLWTGFNVVMDGAAVVFPGVPSINGVKRMIEASDTLRQTLQIGIDKYGRLQNVSIPSGWERHHIFEKRFATALDTTSYSMLAIAIPKEIHQKITNKMAQKIKPGQDYTKLTEDEIIDAHIEGYRELYYATSNTDEEAVYEFLYKFARTGQHTARD